MFATTRSTAGDTQRTVDSEPFQAVVVTAERLGVLRALTQQAVEHFGHDHLFVRDVRVAPSGAGAAFLATAQFSAFAPQA